MKTTSENKTTLKWNPEKGNGRKHLLTSGDEVVGSLTKHGVIDSTATAEAPNGQWTFKFEGLVSPHVAIRLPGADTNLADFRCDWGGNGTLDLGGGRTYKVSRPRRWGGEWRVSGPAGETLLSVKVRLGLLKAQGSVEVMPEAQPYSEDLPLLMLLGLYLGRTLLEYESSIVTV
jgi:hypothetical protein